MILRCCSVPTRLRCSADDYCLRLYGPLHSLLPPCTLPHPTCFWYDLLRDGSCSVITLLRTRAFFFCGSYLPDLLFACACTPTCNIHGTLSWDEPPFPRRPILHGACPLNAHRYAYRACCCGYGCSLLNGLYIHMRSQLRFAFAYSTVDQL